MSSVASSTPEWLKRFAELVAATERETCALLCEDGPDPEVVDEATRGLRNGI
jgi:hypothetical protein